MITDDERKKFIAELNTKKRELEHRMFFKVANHNKAAKLCQVNLLLQQADLFVIEGAIKDARSKTEVFNYGLIGQFLAGVCMFSIKPKTKSDLLLDKIENAFKRT